jgi:hypothetical protein
MQGFKWLFGRGRRYNDLSVSIQEHIEQRAEELIDEGITRKQAEQTARREFGNVTLLREHSREEWQWSGLESILAEHQINLPPAEKVSWVCRHRASDARYRNRRKHDGLQRGQRCAREAAALSGFRSTCGLVA